ncbi:hypothetical protein GQ43DRAFT_47046 [Delitschia confertaspora ATCC 74209]|uniref:Meiotically up-regulated protein Msb1/Mug8 domain-containing protein n=1 Tax=Delitschia confertaspora ATCC 74209 TaxID=1513339 RepID=A0A9P4JPX7_9PLEO|nr:hypothetical protein GQ43DRAFT_47046 [Delitschia confertaspora ATCC 74209]
MPFFKNVFKSKEGGSRAASKAGKYLDQADGGNVAQPKPRWEDAWSRKSVAPEEMQELIHVCTQEMKSRALDMPFLLLPFRPDSNQSSARNFVRNFFKASYEGSMQYTGEGLRQELRLTEPLVLCSIMKWSWSRLPGGVVTWDAYELFRIGESDSNFARHAFDTFIPLSVDSEARRMIIFDFFDLLSAVAARAKTNGMGGRKLSRMAGWWAFEHSDDGKGFDGGYRSWGRAADAASHLFFAYLRSLSPDPANSIGGISALPRSLQALISQTEYPPQAPELMQTTTTKVVMIVDSVSPTPFALLRRAKHFEYRDDDEALQQFSAYDDPVKALTDECRRVLDCISSINQSQSQTAVLSLDVGTQDASWSRFEDMGFSGLLDSPLSANSNGTSFSGNGQGLSSLRSAPHSRNTDFGRPTTPSWADFLSSGFADENGSSAPAPLLLPPDKILPPIGEATRVHSSQSHMRNGLDDLEPGELASITQFDLDDTFWWVWMTSLAGEEPTERKAAFGRCALIETRIPGAKWLVIEEQVKGASPGPEEGAYIAEKKGRFSFTKRGRLGRRKSTGKKPLALPQEPYNRTTSNTPMSKTSIAADQHARIQAAAARLARQEKGQTAETGVQRRARVDDNMSMKTNSVLTLQPNLMSEAGPAMKWDKKYGEGAKERDAIRAKYLGDVQAGKGSGVNLLTTANGGPASPITKEVSNRELPPLPRNDTDSESSRKESAASPGHLSLTPSPEVTTIQRSESPVVSKMAPPVKPSMLDIPLDEKPVPHSDNLDQHPALRKPLPNRKPVAVPPPKSFSNPRTDREHIPASNGTPTQKPSPKKLKKNTGGGGFRKLFGKKKPDASGPPGTAQSIGGGESAQGAHPGRDLSHVHSAPSPVPEASPKQSVDTMDVVRTHSPALEPSAAVLHTHSPSEAYSAATSSSGAHEHHETDHVFDRFDQGPVEDMPAFVPDYTNEDVHQGGLVEPSPHGYQDHDLRTPTQQTYQPQEEYLEDNEAPSTVDDVSVSEQSVDLTQPVVPSQDRWAQIRRNAAERAARLSEEQSRRSQSQSYRTDEGETSGEETIESRVARIKARVAELTGNVDGQGSPTGGRR